jgi:hypothetical protein
MIMNNPRSKINAKWCPHLHNLNMIWTDNLCLNSIKRCLPNLLLIKRPPKLILRIKLCPNNLLPRPRSAARIKNDKSKISPSPARSGLRKNNWNNPLFQWKSRKFNSAKSPLMHYLPCLRPLGRCVPKGTNLLKAIFLGWALLLRLRSSCLSKLNPALYTLMRG